MKRRNRSSADIGRYAAAGIAIIFILFLSVRAYASSTLQSIENSVDMKLSEISGRVRLKQELTKKDYTELSSYLAQTGMGFDLDVSIGIAKVSDDEAGLGEAVKIHDMVYSSGILERLESSGAIPLSEGDTFTITATRRGKSASERLSDLFITTRIRRTVFTAGAVIGQ